MSNFLKSPIIFLGFGRSGTTVISNVIFNHPKLAWVSNYQDKFPRCKSINVVRNIQDNHLWRLKKKNFGSKKASLLTRFFFQPSESYTFWNWVTQKDFGRNFFWQQTEEENRNDIRNFCNDIVKYQKRERFSFKVTGPSRLEYLHSIFPDAKFVWIKRNPLPNIRSLLNVDFYQNRKKELWWKGDVYSERELSEIKSWRKQPELIAAIQYYKIHEIFRLEKLKLGIENNVYEVRYEDFVNNSFSEIKNLLEFLELKFHEDVFNYLNTKTIYNSNKKIEFYLSKELDKVVMEVANSGIR